MQDRRSDFEWPGSGRLVFVVNDKSGWRGIHKGITHVVSILGVMNCRNQCQAICIHTQAAGEKSLLSRKCGSGSITGFRRLFDGRVLVSSRKQQWRALIDDITIDCIVGIKNRNRSWPQIQVSQMNSL